MDASLTMSDNPQFINRAHPRLESLCVFLMRAYIIAEPSNIRHAQMQPAYRASPNVDLGTFACIFGLKIHGRFMKNGRLPHNF